MADPMFAQQGKAVVPGIIAVFGRTAMDHDGKFGDGSQLHLFAKNPLLNVARRVIVEIIEANFAPGYDFGMPRQALHLYISVFIREARLMRMNAERGVNEIVLFG